MKHTHAIYKNVQEDIQSGIFTGLNNVDFIKTEFYKGGTGND